MVVLRGSERAKVFTPMNILVHHVGECRLCCACGGGRCGMLRGVYYVDPYRRLPHWRRRFLKIPHNQKIRIFPNSCRILERGRELSRDFSNGRMDKGLQSPEIGVGNSLYRQTRKFSRILWDYLFSCLISRTENNGVSIDKLAKDTWCLQHTNLRYMHNAVRELLVHLCLSKKDNQPYLLTLL